MRTRHLSALRLGVAAALLAGSAGIAQARTSVAVGVNLGFGYPYAGYGYAAPIGGVAVGGYYPYRGYHGWRGYGPHGHGWRAGWARPWSPGFYVTAPLVLGAPLVYGTALPPVAAEPPPAGAQAPSKPDPVIYPRDGQDAQQTEADRQKCNRWATTQPAAVADAATFQRAVEACMDAHGYTMR